MTGDYMLDTEQNAAASLIERVAARLIDYLVLGVIIGLGVLACAQPFASLFDSSKTMQPIGWFGPVFYLLGLGIAVHWLWTWAACDGRSPGRAAMGLILVGEDNQPIGYWPVAVRALVRDSLAGTVLGGIANVVVLATDRSERPAAIHDKLPMVRSRVVQFEGTERVLTPTAAAGVVSAKAPKSGKQAQAAGQETWPGYSPTMSVPENNPWTLPQPPVSSPATMGQDAGLAAFVDPDAQQEKPRTGGFSYAEDVKSGAIAQPVAADAEQPVVEVEPVVADDLVAPLAEGTAVAAVVEDATPDGDEAQVVPLASAQAAADEAAEQVSDEVAEDQWAARDDVLVVDLTQEPTGSHDSVPQVSDSGAEHFVADEANDHFAAGQELPVQAHNQALNGAGQTAPMTGPVWVLATSDGQHIVVEGRCLIGRKPAIEQDDLVDSTLVPIRDEDLSMSKTHALVGVDEEGLWIVDWESRNGTFIAPAGEEWEQLDAGQAYRLLEGDTVRFGRVEAQVLLEQGSSVQG